ncbi:rRNA-processing protein bfr2 [Xylographa vitiligo]|nr:rRNA-processing protein bfr2 [Xylographa vitiligo]
MAPPRPFKTLAEQVADLDDPAPRDIDPEEFGGPLDYHEGDEDDGSQEEEREDGRGHYEDVGKSKLRQPQQPSLGPRYDGLQIGREDLQGGEDSGDDPFGSGASQQEELSQDEDEVVDPDEVDFDMAIGAGGEDEDINSDDAFGEGDEEAFKRFAFKGSGMSREKALGSGKRRGTKTQTPGDEDEETNSDLDGLDEENTSLRDNSVDGEDDPELDADTMSLDSSASDDNNLNDSDAENDSNASSSTGDSSASSTPLPSSRAALRQMMGEEQTTVLATISLAAKADAAKGRAVTHQRSTFDTLLNTRIRLQKALIATNSLSAVPPPDTALPSTAIHAAETAALALFSSLSALLHSLHPSLPPPPPATRTTPTPTLATALTPASRPHHRATLTKWAHKTHLPSTLPPRSRLAPSTTPTQQPLLSVLDAHLSAPNLPRLLARTRLPRSCAPLQAAAGSAPTAADDDNAGAVFDDADFYALLLRELVERKMAATGTAGGGRGGVSLGSGVVDSGWGDVDASALTRVAKVRKRVDTKASKGRKMRYAVMERLQNFMAREEGNGGWGEGRVGELFGGLLGRRVGGLGEGEGSGNGSGSEAEGEALRLFGGEG